MLLLLCLAFLQHDSSTGAEEVAGGAAEYQGHHCGCIHTEFVCTARTGAAGNAIKVLAMLPRTVVESVCA